MLVSRLYNLFRKNIPKHEKVALSGCPKGDGIWDVLGYYDFKSYSIIICEPEVEKYGEQMATQLKLDETFTRLILRQLVRLHEHAHAMLHTGNFDGIKRRFKMGYRNLPANINEPLTEFIAWSVVRKVGIQLFESVFNEVDKNAPSYYRAWNQIKELIDNKSKPDSKNYVSFVPGLVQVARDGNWNNFEHFLEGIKDHYKLIETIAVLGWIL